MILRKSLQNPWMTPVGAIRRIAAAKNPFVFNGRQFAFANLFLGETGEINELRAKKFGFAIFQVRRLFQGFGSKDGRLAKNRN
ncbi:MAG: hypothetical protein ABSE69_14480 [Roseiarcus sp.]